MPTSRPRIRHISASVRCTRSAPSSSTRPRTAAPCGSSPITASAVIDLPDPLSPITPSTSPAPAAIATSDRIGSPWMASERSEIASRLTARPPFASRAGVKAREATARHARPGLDAGPNSQPHHRKGALRKQPLPQAPRSSSSLFRRPTHRRRRGGAGTTPPRACGRRAATAGRPRDRPHVRTRRSRGSIRSRKPVAHQVEPEHGQDDREPGEQRQPRRDRDQGLALGQHPPPGRRRRLRPEPDIGEPGLGEDAERELDRPLHDQEVGHVRQDVLDRDPRRALARHPRRLDEVPRPERQRRAAGQPGEDRHVEDADRDDRVQRRGPEDRGDHDGDEERRERRRRGRCPA